MRGDPAKCPVILWGVQKQLETSCILPWWVSWRSKRSATEFYKRWPGGHLLACQKSLAEFAARRRQRNEIIFSRDMCVRENTFRAASVEFVRHRRANYARSRPQAFCRKNPEGFSTVAEVAARPPLFLRG